MEMKTSLDKAIAVGKSWGIAAGFEMKDLDGGFILEGQHFSLYFDPYKKSVYVNQNQLDDIIFESLAEELAEMRTAQSELMPILRLILCEFSDVSETINN